MNEQFTVTDLHYVFGIDALESSRPIDFEVNTPDEINQMFDAISYEKGKPHLYKQGIQLTYCNLYDFNIKAVASSACVLTF